MDDIRLENALNSLAEGVAKVDSRMATMEGDIAEIKATMSTKQDVAELRHSMTLYAKHVETMMNSFAATTVSVEDRLEDLRKRVDNLEKRIPPQAA